MTITIKAPAKLTLSLRVVGVRDDGYHLIDADMTTLSLHDLVSIDPHGSGVSVGGPFGAGVPLDASNLVTKALTLAQRTAAVHIEKHIPHGGGLGGGSADAAAVLRWAGFTDLAAAARVGADIPFCMVGGRARVRGIGEIIEPTDAVRPAERGITLIVPPLHVATPAVYAAWDELPAHQRRGELNDLEAAALVVEPQLAVWRDRIREAAGVTPTLAGSGATWFLRGEHRIADALSEATVVLTACSG